MHLITMEWEETHYEWTTANESLSIVTPTPASVNNKVAVALLKNDINLTLNGINIVH